MLLATLTAGACSKSDDPKPATRAAANENDDELGAMNSDDEASAEHARIPLRAMGSLLVHQPGETHKVVEVRLAGETDAPAIRNAPITAMGSLLVHLIDDVHIVEPIAMRAETGEPAPPLLVDERGSQTGTNVIAPGVVPARGVSPTPGTSDIGVTGTIIRVEDRVITVLTTDGDKKVTIPVSANLFHEAPGSLASLRPGEIISVVKLPDGTARSIHMFPGGIPTPESGLVPLGGANQGSLLLNGVITGIFPGGISVSAVGQSFPLRVDAGTRVIASGEASPAEVAAGRRVSIKAVRSAQGTITAMSLFLPEALPLAPSTAPESALPSAAASPAPA